MARCGEMMGSFGAMLAGVVAALVVVVVVLWVGHSYVEARAFESATGEAVSTWEAMFLELRVSGATR